MGEATIEDRVLPEVVPSRPRSWLRRLPLRLSVRAIMITVLIVGFGLGWIVHRSHVQRDTIEEIRAFGGQVVYDWQLKRLPNATSQFDPQGRPHGPEWLVAFLGPDFLGHVERVHLGPRNRNNALKQVGKLEGVRILTFSRGVDLLKLASVGMNALPNSGLSRLQGVAELVTTDLAPQPIQGTSLKYLKNLTQLERLDLPDDASITDADLAQLARLTGLRFLGVHDPRITDVGLAALNEMTSLKILMLSGTQVSGAGLRSLRAMTQLDRLNLSQTRVDDLGSIAHLTRLTELDLSLTPIDDDGLAPIAGLAGLNVLALRGTHVTARGIAHLNQLSKLQTLSLANTRVDDAGSNHLAGLTALSTLNLSGTQIGDVAISHLARLPRLSRLSAAGTQITDRGLASLTACKSLRVLEVRNTRISHAGITAFKTANLGVQVVRSDILD